MWVAGTQASAVGTFDGYSMTKQWYSVKKKRSLMRTVCH
jgi:hypothetical protein